LLIHEQNAIAGFTNRCLAHLARRVLTAFPGSFAPQVRAQVIGNPVRREISDLPPPAQRFAQRQGPIRVLVVGGSQGAARLNAMVPFALARAAASLQFEVQHQSGERWIEAATRNYAEAGITARLQPFIEDMAAAYGAADLVICRAGALTVSELAAAGVASILVPFPAATLMIAERELSVERLTAELLRLCSGRGRLLAMAERARALARPRAVQELADACVELVRGERLGGAA
jgi:UDP-N-acetylglucosamine--N-acetylmuramyl-(pentapeptide) pyrophosphoryl-undecaprenol N-acetylglucosamine transferase